MIEIQRALIEAGLLPEEMPQNFTFRKVREVLIGIEVTAPSNLSDAIAAAKRLELHSPLAAIIFIKHHLLGAHEVEIDRVDETEEQANHYAVLVYPEGEVPIRADLLPDNLQAGTRLHYDPNTAEYTSSS